MRFAHRALAFLLAAAVCVALASCLAPREVGSSADSVLRVEADAALGDLPAALVNAYEAQSHVGSISFARTERSRILTDLKAGTIDVALILYPDEDRSVFSTAVGFDAISVVVGADLKVDGLSSGDARAIFAGHKANWADVGGPDLQIQVVVPFASKSERAAFEGLLMQHQPIGASALLGGQAAQVATLVRVQAGRVGLVAGNTIPDGLKGLMIDGAGAPGPTAPRNTYPLIATIALAAPAEPQGDAKVFLDWILSADGQKIVGNYALRVN